MNALESLNNINTQRNKEILFEIQKDYDFKIYAGFSELLTDYNVAKPKYTSFKKNNIEFNINYFFGFSSKPYQDFRNTYSTYLERVPNDLFPIASINGGDLLLAHKEDNYIYIWFHEEHDLGLEGNNEYPKKVANSLYDLLEILEPTKEPTKEEIERAKKEGKIKKVTPFGLKLKNEKRAKEGLPPLTMEDFQ